MAMFSEERGLSVPHRSQEAPRVQKPGAASSGLTQLNSNMMLGDPQSESARYASHPIIQSLSVAQTFRPSLMSLSSSPHFGLGLPGYVQFTAPMRRYSDLLVLYQVKAALMDELCGGGSSSETGKVSPQQLALLLVEDSRLASENKRVVNNSNRFWHLHHLALLQKHGVRQRPDWMDRQGIVEREPDPYAAGQPFKAVVTKVFDSNGRREGQYGVMLTDTGIQGNILELPSSVKQLYRGQEVMVSIRKVNAHANVLDFNMEAIA
jgi:exoribonuclease R